MSTINNPADRRMLARTVGLVFILAGNVVTLVAFALTATGALR